MAHSCISSAIVIITVRFLKTKFSFYLSSSYRTTDAKETKQVLTHTISQLCRRTKFTLGILSHCLLKPLKIKTEEEEEKKHRMKKEDAS